MKVLIVDDTELVLAVTKGMVRSLGYDVSIAADGDEAWKKFGEEHFDVVISDWHMPSCDGLELCRRIRANYGYTVPFILASTMVDDEEAEKQIISAGVDRYLAKPVEYAMLQQLLAQIEHKAHVVHRAS
ncbi:MAG: response regulator [Opitutae bacterium]|nr:response regulator [Opitutae bacterium]